MEIGWIDFSKTERNKVLNVLNLLGEQGVLDELGIASIRDSFSDLFFPGTSTIQTRAKYFLIVPYALKDLEYVNAKKPVELVDEFDKKEEKCAHIFYENNPKERGIIGVNSIQSNSWVKRPPSNIYLAGLRKYGILNYKISIKQYIKFLFAHRVEKDNALNIGFDGTKTEFDHDDRNAGVNSLTHLLNIPTYNKSWLNDLNINLTFEEGQFLKNQIISNCKGSMMAYILEEEMTEILEFNSFYDFESIIFKFPDEIQNNYFKAVDFSEFVFALRIIYNLMASDYKNQKAIKLFNGINFSSISDIDINEIMFLLKVSNPQLKNFLNESKKLMIEDDLEALKSLILSRETFLKGFNRSRLCHPGEYDTNSWFSGERLDYRFGNAQIILRDIFKSQEGEI